MIFRLWPYLSAPFRRGETWLVLFNTQVARHLAPASAGVFLCVMRGAMTARGKVIRMTGASVHCPLADVQPAGLPCPLSAARSRHRNGFKRAVSVLSGLTCRRRDAGQIYCKPQWPNSEIRGSLGGVVHTWARESPTSREDMIMRLSSGFAAPSVIAILSTALLSSLSGTAMSQTATGSGTQLPTITVEQGRNGRR